MSELEKPICECEACTQARLRALEESSFLRRSRGAPVEQDYVRMVDRGVYHAVARVLWVGRVRSECRSVDVSLDGVGSLVGLGLDAVVGGRACRRCWGG